MNLLFNNNIEDPQWGTWQDNLNVRNNMKNIARNTDQATQSFYASYPYLTEHKDTFFTLAVEYGNFQVALAMFNDGARINGLNDADQYERPLAFALRSQNHNMIRWLLSLPNIDPNVIVATDSDTVGLVFAIEQQMPIDIIHNMLSLGALDAFEELEYDDGWYPLSAALHTNNYHIIQLLLFFGADPHYDDGEDPVADFATNDIVKNAIQSWSEQNTQNLRQMVGRNLTLLHQNPNMWLAACGQFMY
jgi:ankyrin repeat protein